MRSGEEGSGTEGEKRRRKGKSGKKWSERCATNRRAFADDRSVPRTQGERGGEREKRTYETPVVADLLQALEVLTTLYKQSPVNRAIRTSIGELSSDSGEGEGEGGIVEGSGMSDLLN